MRRGGFVQDYDIVKDISGQSQLKVPWFHWNVGTYEKTTFLGSRFLVNGKRSGSLFEVQRSIAQLPHGNHDKRQNRSRLELRVLAEVCWRFRLSGCEGGLWKSVGGEGSSTEGPRSFLWCFKQAALAERRTGEG